ncbi:MAG: hypothetical protein ACREBW_01560 [Candidatus Micrarchaeaceae archaeon]
MATHKSTTRLPGDFIVAGKKRASDWIAFKGTLVVGGRPVLWVKAYKDYFHARLSHRYLKPLKLLQTNGLLKGEGFSIVAIQCSLIEFLESTIQGMSYRYSRNGNPPLRQYEYSNSGLMFESFLANRTPFNGAFSLQQAHDFYVSVRCGVLHEARTKNGWTIRAKSKTGQIIDPNLQILYRDTFQTGLRKFLKWYKSSLETDVHLQEAFIRKFDSLCV